MLRLCYGPRYGLGVRSSAVSSTQSFPLERSQSIRPTGIVLAILSTFLAIPVLMTGGAEGSGEILAASIAVPESSTASTSVDESTSSSLFDGAQSSDLFQAGASVAVPYGQSVAPEALPSSDLDRRPATPLSPSTTLIAAPTTFESGDGGPRTTARPATSAPASTSPAPTSAPTTSPATTAAPPTEPAPVTDPPATKPTTTTAPEATTPPPTEVSSSPTAEQWAQLRHCEASGSYTIVNPSGKYHGAYQFGVATWNGLAASMGRSDLVGVLPSQASPADQDALALELWNRRGSSPWPHCGRYLPAG